MAIAEDILTAYEAVLGAVVWDPTQAFTIESRKRLATIGEAEKKLIVLGLDGAEEFERLTAVKMLVRYPIAFAIAVKETAKLGDTATMTAWRQQLRLAVLKPLTGVDGFNVVQPRPIGRIFAESPLAEGWTWSPFGVWVEVIENISV